MNRLHMIFLPISVVVVVLSSCKDDGVSVDNRSIGLYAKVVDASGNAISGVNVHYLFSTSTNPLTLNAWIHYGLSTPQVVTLKVFDPFDREVATLIHAQQQPVGQHTILFDSSVTNGVYSYRLQMGDSMRTGSFYIRDDDITRLQQKSPLTTSDQRGQFFLSPSILGIGRTFQGQFSTETIYDSIAVVLVKVNYRTFIQSFRLNTTTPTDKIFTLESNQGL
jgi:hypothetical protein